MLGDRKNNQHGTRTAAWVKASAAAKSTFGILPQDLDISDPTSMELKG